MIYAIIKVLFKILVEIKRCNFEKNKICIYIFFILILLNRRLFYLPFIHREIYEKIYKYLGIMLVPTLLFFLLYGIVFLIKDKKLRLFWELRLYYTLLLLIIGAYLYILFNSGVSFTNVKSFEINENFLKNLINKSLFEYNIGYLPTYILYESMNISLKFNQYPFYYFYYFLIGLEVFLIILMFFNPTRKSIKSSTTKRKKKKERAKIEAELMEQIKIKEDLERKEALKIQNQEKIEEEKIKKKINSSEKNQKNKKSSRRKTDENQIEDRIKKQMDGIVLQKTVTINKEDLRWF